MRVQIKSINIGSAFKIGAIVSGIMSLVFGFPSILLQTALLSGMVFVSTPQTGAQQVQGFNALGTGLGIAGICIGIGVAAAFGAIFGGIGAAVGAFIYNLASGWVGGVEVKLDELATLE